jgi:hypothetical protein
MNAKEQATIPMPMHPKTTIIVTRMVERTVFKPCATVSEQQQARKQQTVLTS